MMEVHQKNILSCKCKRVASPPGTFLLEMPAEHTLRRCMASRLFLHNDTCRLLAKECTRRARANLLSVCWASSWQRLRFAATAEVLLRARERKCLLLGIHITTFSESRICHPETHKKHSVYFCKSGNLCGALLRHNE